MDFTNQGSQAPGHTPVANQASTRRSGRTGLNKDLWNRIGVVAAVVAVVILLIGLIGVVYANNNNATDEYKYVNTAKLQAVFLNTGQVYFGNLKALNNKYAVLTNIYYLQTTSNGSTSNTASNVTLVKLGCELHRPYDQMVINRSEVTFWENLQPDGQVAKAVSTFQQQNPNGQKCADQSTSSGNTSSSAQPAGSSAKP